MNDIVITLLSVKPCELNRFLSKYFNKNMDIEEGAFRLSIMPKSFLDSSLILATLIDNNDDYQIEAYISISHQPNIHVSDENITDVIKYLYFLE